MMGAKRMIVIGITELECGADIVGMLRKIMKKAGLRISIIQSYDFHSSNSSSVSLNHYLDELERNHMDIVIVKIKLEQIAQGLYKKIRFNILVHNNINKRECLEDMKAIFDKMGKDDMAIINVDEETSLQLLRDSKMCVITYGLCSKATITASSIEEGTEGITLIYCLQRTIHTIENIIIEPQEFPIKAVSSKEQDVYDTLAAVTTALLCNVNVEETQKIVL